MDRLRHKCGAGDQDRYSNQVGKGCLAGEGRYSNKKRRERKRSKDSKKQKKSNNRGWNDLSEKRGGMGGQ